MKTSNFRILPKKGFGDLHFGISIEEVIDIAGQADDVEDLEDNDGEYNTLVMNYWKDEYNVFFEGEEKSLLTCIESSNRNAILFDNKVFELGEKELIDLMEYHGFELTDTEEEIWGEKRLSFENALMDFYYENGKLVTINWGVNRNDVK
ncbi:hypothetical protein ACFLRZ_02570 [Bacteroidota bacterium]